LLEAFDAADLQIAREVLALRRGHDEKILVGLNCRDLDKLTVELSRLSELAENMPPGFAPVAESGVNTFDDVTSIVGLGYRVALIGTTLMKAPQPRELLGKMLSTGRQAAMSKAARTLSFAKSEVNEG